jgi:LuxR family maltose regulon positive regulatory protein
MKNLLEKPDYLNRYIYYDIFTGWFYIQIGQIEKTASWLKNDFEESDLNSITFGFETLVKAKYHIYGKRYHAALAAIENQKSTYGFSGYLFGRITIAVVRAVCCYRLQDKSGAIRVLEEAWEQAAPNGLDMIFIEMGRDMRTLTAAALKDPSCTVPREWLEKIHRSASAYAKKVFAVSKAYQPPKQDRHKDFAVSLSLSARELEVLIGLSQGLTREEIGGMASISVNTIKSIIQNIYSKLGAVNRADAIRIATSLGIL